jgi:Tetracyclin repressor-like, C-terminal domain
LLRAYLQKHQNQIQPQNLDLTVFVLGCTVESLTHTAVIEQPQLLQDEQLEREITNLLLSYLIGKTC